MAPFVPIEPLEERIDVRARSQAAQKRGGLALDGSIERASERRSGLLLWIGDVDGSMEPRVRSNVAPEALPVTVEGLSVALEGFIASSEGFLVSAEGAIGALPK